ncbi:V protein [memana virus]|uniref:Non-structural protein V n=1 Tax=memana virus TaxID=2940997 RepID=A0AAE9KYQ1_9MONO|nr:V protein [memana virus]
MSDYLSKQRAKSVDNGIKILEDLEKERKESRDDSPTKEAAGPIPKKKPRTKSRPTILPTDRSGSDVSAGPAGSGETSEYGSGEAAMSSIRSDELPSEYNQSTRAGGSDNPRDGKSDGRNTSGDGSDGDGGSGKVAGSSGTNSAGENQPADGSSLASLSLSDIEKILTLDEESERLDRTGEVAEGMSVTEATAEGIEEILNAPPSNVHRRLRGVKEAITDTTLYDHGGKVVKRGHRREYCIDCLDGRAVVRAWCSPLCSPITVAARPGVCTCGLCPKYCRECSRD